MLHCTFLRLQIKINIHPKHFGRMNDNVLTSSLRIVRTVREKKIEGTEQ